MAFIIDIKINESYGYEKSGLIKKKLRSSLLYTDNTYTPKEQLFVASRRRGLSFRFESTSNV